MNLQNNVKGVAIAALSTLLLASCGGDDNSTPLVPIVPTTVKLTGVAAVGSPLSGSTVTIKCAASGGAIIVSSVKTNNLGQWSASLDASPVCVVQATGGTVNGFANNATYSSVTANGGNVNITPVTDMVVALLINSSDTNNWFANITSEMLGSYNATTISAAINTLFARLPALVDAGNPINVPFIAMPGNPLDDLLASIASALTSLDTSLSDLEQALIVNDTASLSAINSTIQNSCATEPSKCDVTPPDIINPPVGTADNPITTRFIDLNGTTFGPTLLPTTIVDAGSASTTTNFTYGIDTNGSSLTSFIVPAERPFGVTFGTGIESSVEISANALDAAVPAAMQICSNQGFILGNVASDVLITTDATPIISIPGVTGIATDIPTPVLTFDDVYVNCKLAPLSFVFYDDGTAKLKYPNLGTTTLSAADVSAALLGIPVNATFMRSSSPITLPLYLYLYSYPSASRTMQHALVASVDFRPITSIVVWVD